MIFNCIGLVRRLFLAAFVLGCSLQTAHAVLRPQPGVTVAAMSTQLTEDGGVSAFSIELKLQPSGDVRIAIEYSDQCLFSASELIFTSENWATAQTVSVVAIDDEAVEGTHACSPNAISASGPDDYDFVTIERPAFEISDNDKSNLTISNVTDGDEAGPQDNTLKVALSAPAPKLTIVDLTYSGTATGDGVDYTGPTEVIIPAGETEVLINLSVVEDKIPEATETVIISASTENDETKIEVGTAASKIADQKSFDATAIQNGFAAQTSNFMTKRLDFIAALEPRAHRLLNRNHIPRIAVKTTGAEISGVTISPTADVPASPELWNVWMEGEFGRGLSDSSFYLGYAGADYLLSDQLTIGVLAQVDATTADDVSGTGWMVGPYISAEIADHVFLDLRGLWGRSENNASQDISGDIYAGNFTTKRWLLEAQLAGNYDFNNLRITPDVTALYAQDLQPDFMVSNGLDSISVSGQTVGLGRLAAGVNFTYLGKFDDVNVEPFIGAKLNWNLGNAAARGAVALGFNLRSEDNLISLSASYDGIGVGDFSSVSTKLSFSHQF